MTRLIKKYKNRRLYDTESSQYITLEQLKSYVLEGLIFKVEESETGLDITNSILLQIIVEMEAGPSRFLSSDILRHIITLANHPMHTALQTMMEHMVQQMNKPFPSSPYQQASTQWNEQMQDMMQQWQKLFK